MRFEKFFPGLVAKRIRAETDLKKAKYEQKITDEIFQYHNHGAGDQNAMDYDDEINDADYDIGKSKKTLMARSRDEFMGNSIASGAIKRIRTNVIGTGIKLKANIDNTLLQLDQNKKEEIENKLEHLWKMWSNSTECDYYRTSKLSQLQSLAILTLLIDGECLAALTYKVYSGELFAPKIRLLDPASCENPYITNGKDIVNGVEKDKKGVVVAYHFKKNKESDETIRVKVHGSLTGRKNLLVLMDKERIGQRRGVPLISPVLEILHQMRKFTHAELMAATINSYFAAFIENENESTKNKSPFKKKDGTPVTLESGIISELAKGQTIKFPETNRPNSGFTKFMETMCVHLGAALELSPELLLLKFSNNYSASKGALLESWKMLKMRRQWFTDDFMQPIYDEFVDYCVAMELIDLPGYENPINKMAYRNAQWFGQAQGSLDPLKEARASEVKIRNQLTTRAKEAMEINGTDVMDNMGQLNREELKIKKYKLNGGETN